MILCAYSNLYTNLGREDFFFGKSKNTELDKGKKERMKAETAEEKTNFHCPESGLDLESLFALFLYYFWLVAPAISPTCMSGLLALWK